MMMNKYNSVSNFRGSDNAAGGDSDQPVVPSRVRQPQQQQDATNAVVNPAYAAALNDTRNSYSYTPAKTNHHAGNNDGSARVVSNDRSNANLTPSSSYEIIPNSMPANNNNTNAAITTSYHEAAPSAGAAASYQDRNQHMPQWMKNNTAESNAPPSTTSYHAESSRQSQISHNSYYYQPHRPSPSHYNYQQQYPSQPRHPANISYSHQYSQSYNQSIEVTEMPPDHTPTWQHILPAKYFVKRKEQRMKLYGRSRRKFVLSLINLWEFTVTTESLDIYGQSQEEVFHGLRGPIKKIAKDHVGKDGRRGAIFERGAGGEGILPDDPSLKQSTAGLTNENGNNTGKGKWRIPLGAYQALFSYLTREGSVEGIAPEQLRVATLGRERADKKEYPSVKSLLERGVSQVVAEALAPYQRGGVEFIIEKEGKALLADEVSCCINSM